MKILESIDGLILETLLLSELSASFEFEAIIPLKVRDIENWEETTHFEDPDENPYERLIDFLNSNGFDWEEDGSIRSDKGKGIEIQMWLGDITPRNIKRFMKEIRWIYDFGARTNSSCGFHAHFGMGSEEGVEPLDALFFVYHFVKQGLFDKYRKFNGINQFEENLHAPYSDLEDMVEEFESEIRPYISDLSQQDMFMSNNEQVVRLGEKLSDFLIFIQSKKKLLIRIHPQGTVEWRGLRGLLDSRSGDVDGDINTIKRYLIDFVLPFTSDMKSLLSGKGMDILGATKPELNHALRVYNKSSEEKSKLTVNLFDGIKDYDLVRFLLDSMGMEDEYPDEVMENPFIKEKVVKHLDRYKSVIKSYPNISPILKSAIEAGRGVPKSFDTKLSIGTLSQDEMLAEGVDLDNDGPPTDTTISGFSFHNCRFYLNSSKYTLNLIPVNLRGCLLVFGDKILSDLSAEDIRVIKTGNVGEINDISSRYGFEMMYLGSDDIRNTSVVIPSIGVDEELTMHS